MANHVETVHPHRPLQKSVPAYMIHITEEYWAHTNKTTGEVTTQPGQINAAISPETGKPKSTGT